jgi:CDGSH-type Zn-finger protein
MMERVVAQKAPFPTKVEAGETYYWCACGRSANQPFCDGSHQGTGFEPIEHTATKSGTIFFCGCKATGKEPLCDGSHARL